jgi:hypothetical protein
MCMPWRSFSGALVLLSFLYFNFMIMLSKHTDYKSSLIFFRFTQYMFHYKISLNLNNRCTAYLNRYRENSKMYSRSCSIVILRPSVRISYSVSSHFSIPITVKYYTTFFLYGVFYLGPSLTEIEKCDIFY